MVTPITIIQDALLGPSVYGRELYKLTTEPTASRDTFTDRFRHNQTKLGLVEGKDFIETSAVVPDKHPTKRYIEFIITLEAAIKVASIQTKGRGRGVMAYIEAYQLNAIQPTLTTADRHPDTQPELSFTASLGPQLTEGKPESTGAPKSRSQQLLEEAQRLQQLANEELQREAEEQQKANSLVDEQPGTLPEMLTMLDTRIDGVEHKLDALERKFDLLERKVNTVLYFFQQASFATRSLGPVSLPVDTTVEPVTPTDEATPEPAPAAEPTTRVLLVRLVNSYAAADRKSEHDTWKWLYGQFNLRKGFNVYAQAIPAGKGKDESYLALIEQHGHIEELYKLAKKLMVLPELK